MTTSGAVDCRTGEDVHALVRACDSQPTVILYARRIQVNPALVEFEPDYRLGYFGLAGMEIELSELIGRKADLRTPEELSRHFRQQVVDTAEVKYAG